LKLILTLLLTYSTLFCKVYYSKVDPYELRYISSNVSGLVAFIDEDMIGKKLSSKAYLRIDSKLNNKELESVIQKILILKNTIKVNENILNNLKESLSKKIENYKRIENLKIKSRVEKDKEFYNLVSSENSYLNTQKAINILKTQIADLKLREAQLQRNISDKSLSAKGYTLYSIDVKVGQVVNVSTPLAKIADTSRAILTIYLDEEDMADAMDKIIYINGKKTDYKIDRILNIADTKNISKYKAQIVIKSPKLFSKLAKIELKEK
jgi:multidrug efflux pump subunit AcrA (membrane-fusion protein)